MKWYAKDLNNVADQAVIIDEGTGKNIAVAYDKKDMDLIAAAPELLEACKMVLASSTSLGDVVVRVLYSAIAKAEKI